jgi:hypothetical protein
MEQINKTILMKMMKSMMQMKMKQALQNQLKLLERNV